MLKIDGHDNAIVGPFDIAGKELLVYCGDTIIKNLQEEMSYEEAVEFFEFNIAGAYVGEYTPVIVRSCDFY